MSNQYTTEELKDILLNEGYRGVNIAAEEIIILKIEGDAYLICLYPNGDIQILYRAMNNRPFSLAKINQWHTDHRSGTLYRDEGNENILIVQLTIIGLGEKLEKRKVVLSIEMFRHLIKTIDFDELSN
ncbi:hypothetical protein ACLSZP_01710 [Avibacterium avium]|uniref:hypothetical protein n=1 Tax=Avibacterium avium TaxID=751 RepID=UPI003BF7DD2D